MGEVVVVADVRVRPENVERVVRTFEEVVAHTHEEEGCVRYALHRSHGDPCHFVIVERWRSQDDLDAHFRRPHMAKLQLLAPLLAEEPRVLFLEPVPTGDAEKGVLA